MNKFLIDMRRIRMRIVRFWFALMSLAIVTSAHFVYAQEEDAYFGQYEELTTPVATTVAQGKVEVLELFWYGCPHCYKFEPSLQKWLKAKADYIEYVPFPAVFTNEKWKNSAKAFYTAHVLKIHDKIHTAMFSAIHDKGRNLFDEASIGEFFVEQGVSKEEFENTYNSFTVDAKTRTATQLTKKYGIDGVPAIVVNGKYRVLTTNGFDKMLEVVDYLAKKEHDAMNQKTAK
jgi:thiol:disulfide interchange protein DsbA